MTTQSSEFGSNWRVVLASFFGISLGSASLYFYSIGIFIKPLAAEFDWGRGEASIGALVGTICAALAAMPIGRLVDRIGAVPVALISLVMLAIGFVALGTLTAGLLSFVALTAALSILATGSSAIPYSRLIVSNFVKRRGIALGVALSGTGLGAMAIPPLLTPYVAENGWRAGYIALASVVVISLPILWLLLRGADGQPKAAENAAEQEQSAPETTPLLTTLKDPAFICIAITFLLAAIAVFGTIVHFVPMLTDAGLTPEAAGGIAALIGITAIAGRVVAGALLDRLPAGLVTAGLFLLAALGFSLLAFGGITFAIPGALIAGFAIGAENDLLAFLVGRYFPRATYGQAYGALYGVFLLGGAIGPALSGYLFDLSGNYQLSLLSAAGLLVLAAMGTFSFKRLTARA